MLQAGIAAVLLGLLLGASELGFRTGRRARMNDESVAAQAAVWEGALLGLLALLIGFT